LYLTIQRLNDKIRILQTGGGVAYGEISARRREAFLGNFFSLRENREAPRHTSYGAAGLWDPSAEHLVAAVLQEGVFV
jgi:hypothetical protein